MSTFSTRKIIQLIQRNSITLHFKDSKGNLIKTVEANEGDDILGIAHEYDIDLEGAIVVSILPEFSLAEMSHKVHAKAPWLARRAILFLSRMSTTGFLNPKTTKTTCSTWPLA